MLNASVALVAAGIVWHCASWLPSRCGRQAGVVTQLCLVDCACLMQIDKGVFTWESDGDASNAYMKDISFEAKPGTLTMVVGSVASGKSSLLSALIGQMERMQGTVAVGGRVAYVAQSAWIINESVQVS